MFDPDTGLARFVNLFTFQVPLLLTIVLNTNALLRGMRALRHSPQSVIAREMKRVGQYVLVLLAIWVPNLLTYSVRLAQYLRSGKDSADDDDNEDKMHHVSGYYGTVLGVTVLLTTLQGLLNAAVYAFNHKPFAQYLSSCLGQWCGGHCHCHCFPSNSCCCFGRCRAGSASMQKPILESFDESGEPITQNGYVSDRGLSMC